MNLVEALKLYISLQEGLWKRFVCDILGGETIETFKFDQRSGVLHSLKEFGNTQSTELVSGSFKENTVLIITIPRSQWIPLIRGGLCFF